MSTHAAAHAPHPKAGPAANPTADPGSLDAAARLAVVPARHPWRWVATAAVAVLTAMA